MVTRVLPFLAVAALAAADPLLPPAEAVKRFTAPEGFSVDLIAAEPDIVQPIAFCWDARGRIWVVEARTYPTRRNNKPPGGDSAKPTDAQLADIFGGEDRILIFADEDGDGKFETRKVFAEKLNLVSGIELGFGGVYVGAAPYLMHLPDKDGDDKPDGPPEILLDGWGWQDTHETLNSFIWGPDGWLYGCHGVFTHSHVGAPGTAKEKRVPINCGYWRYHPVRRTFEVFAHGTSNSWGFDYNEYGDWFSEACVIPHFWHIIQGGYYLRQSNPLGHFNPHVYTNIETIADHLHYIGNTPHSGNNVSDTAGGGHAHCGLCIYNGDNFPPEYRGRAMMFNIHGQRINQEQLVPEGSGYVARHLPDFVKANDRNFTGVALKVGPDGAVYFIDWYDREKCHRPQPEVWDRSNGRIYRVKYDRTWKPWKGDVAKLDLPAQMKLALGDSGWAARMALRQISQIPVEQLPAGKEADAAFLYERYRLADAAGDGIQALNPKNSAAPAPVPGPATAAKQMQFVWLLAAAMPFHSREEPHEDRFPAGSARSAWEDREPDCRRWAMNFWEPPLAAKSRDRHRIERAAREFREEMLKTAPMNSPRDRLAVAVAVARMKPAEWTPGGPFASPGESPPEDPRWKYLEALVQHAEDAKDHNLPQMYWYAIEPLVPANPERALELAAKSKIPLISQHIARRLAETDGGAAHLVRAMTREKTAAGLVHLLTATQDGLKGRLGVPAPDSWDDAWRNMDDVLARRPDAADYGAEVRDRRAALAAAFGDRRAFPYLREQVLDKSLPAERRELALQVLVQGDDPELPRLVKALLDDPTLRAAALRALPAALK